MPEGEADRLGFIGLSAPTFSARCHTGERNAVLTLSYCGHHRFCQEGKAGSTDDAPLPFCPRGWLHWEKSEERFITKETEETTEILESA